jgi:type II secretory pathway pseudopilin PulG
MIPKWSPCNSAQQKGAQTGFTLVETMVAGLVLIMVMSGIGRMTTSAVAGGGNLEERRRIEEAIENHIQLVQQADSLLTYDRIPSLHRTGEEGITRACRKPAEYLGTVLSQGGAINTGEWLVNQTEEESGSSVGEISENSDERVQLVPAFEDPSITTSAIDTNYLHDNDKAILQIRYSFEAPESNIGIETRELQLSPNFQSYCPPYEAVNQ